MHYSIACLLFIPAMLLPVAGCSNSSEPPSSSAKATSTSQKAHTNTAPKEAPHRDAKALFLSDILKSYQANHIKADKTYKDTQVAFVGQVDTWSTEKDDTNFKVVFQPIANRTAAATFKSKVPIANKAEFIQYGKWIAIRGHCMGESPDGQIVFTECGLTKIFDSEQACRDWVKGK